MASLACKSRGMIGNYRRNVERFRRAAASRQRIIPPDGPITSEHGLESATRRPLSNAMPKAPTSQLYFLVSICRFHSTSGVPMHQSQR